jgi:hypothetical protein
MLFTWSQCTGHSPSRAALHPGQMGHHDLHDVPSAAR